MDRDTNQEEQHAQTPLLSTTATPHSQTQFLDDAGVSLGRSAALHVGGWRGSAYLLGVIVLFCLSFNGILINLVIYLVGVCGQTNATAANTVANIFGTMFLCSFLGAFVSDAYLGRLRTALIFQIITTLIYGLATITVIIISQGSATALARSILLVSLYLLAITCGPVLPNIIILGADQLSSNEDKKKYSKVVIISVSIGQLLAATVVTFIDNGGMWVWGFGLCTAASLGGAILIARGASLFHQYRPSGNPFLRNIQVLVAAWRKRLLPLPVDTSLLHEREGDVSAIPGQPKLRHTSTLSFLDKAAVLSSNETFNPWHLCTVTQVEELKSLVRILPIGMTIILVSVANTQISTLFEEQASLMNRQVATWLAIPPASLNVLFIGSSILTGIAITADGPRLRALCFGCRKHGKATSLQLVGAALVSCTIAMMIAALVEWYCLSQAQEGILVSVLWLMPQTVLVGMGFNLVQTGAFDFFYGEISESMRSIGGSIQLIFIGAGSYVSSILVTLVTAITTQGGQAGWIADNLNEGHLDYFYWFLASCFALSLGIYLVYARSYNHVGGRYITT